MIAFCASAVLVCALAPQAPPGAQGVSVLESRDLAAEMRDLREFLEDENFPAAAATLQRLLEAENDLLIRDEDPWLYVGAAYRARKIAVELPGSVRRAREELVGAQAEQAVNAALDPPAIETLREISHRYAGTAAAEIAEKTLNALLLDRGAHEQVALDPESPIAGLPADWQDALPAPQPDSALRVPAVASLNDPSLPVVKAGGAHKRWSYQFDGLKTPLPQGYGMHRMAIGGGTGYLTDSRELVALDLSSGEVKWRFAGPRLWSSISSTTRESLSQGFNTEETVVAPVLSDGIVIAALQEPVLLGRSQDFAHIAVRKYLPGRRLYAFDAETGDILWKQRVNWLAGKEVEPRGLVASPPAVAAGRVFVPLYDAVGTLDLHLACFDLYSGAHLWTTFLVSGQRETNLFGNVLEELASGMPVADADRVILCTNLGAICAVDASSGAVIWTRMYERTPVLTRQNGEVGRRPVYFNNSPPAYDGDRFVCTPTDSSYALALNADTGGVLRRWRHTGREYGELRNLVAITPAGALFSGSRLAFLAYDASSPRESWTSADLHGRKVSSYYRRGAVLARGEILVPTNRGVAQLDPKARGRRELREAVSWAAQDIGSLQAAPGLLLVLDSRGVTAYASPDALLETLLQADHEPARIAQTLPFLEGLQIDNDPDKALRVARAAETLSERAENREQAERLRLVASRAFLDGERFQLAARAAETVLSSSDRDRRVRAAVQIVDALERHDAASPLLRQAMQILGALPQNWTLRRHRLLEPVTHALGRARYLVAIANNDRDAQREALLELIRLPRRDFVLEDGIPIADWASARLRELIEFHPDQARLLDREASAAFASNSVTAEQMRAFAGTATARDWLDSEMERADLTRAELVERSAWLRDYNPQSRHLPLDAEKLFGSAAPPLLPRSLLRRGFANLGTSDFLGAAATPGGAHYLVRNGGEVTLRRLHADGDDVVAEFPLSGLDLPLTDELSRTLFGSDSVTIVTRSVWARLGFDGSVDLSSLPGRTDRPLQIGRMVVTLSDAEAGFRRAQMRDLDSGRLFFEARLSDSETSHVRMVGNEHVLAMIESGVRQVWVFRPLFDSKPTLVQLPWTPTASDVDAAVASGNRLILPDKGKRTQSVYVLEDGELTRLRQPSDAQILTFQAPEGGGWLLRPFKVGTGDFPWPQAHWMQDGSATEVVHPLEQTYMLGSPLLPRVGGARLSSSNLLCTHRVGKMLSILSLTLTDRTRARWNIELPEIRHSRLKHLQPIPLRGTNGWFVPISLAADKEEASRLHSLLLDDNGNLLGSFDCSPPARQFEIGVYPADGGILLRSGDDLFLLGDR